MFTRRWGCKHEATARTCYEDHLKASHDDAKLEDCGFFIDPCHPFIGASPDALASCRCCGSWIVEIKCPFCYKDSTIEGVASDTKSFLEFVKSNNVVTLKENHAYYYQIQCQLHASQKPYCDLVVWTQKETFIQRIFPNHSMFSNALILAERFFKSCVLPELVGKIFTREKDLVSSSNNVNVCYCKEDNPDKTLVLCSALDCSIKRFHKECLGLKCILKNWKCSACRTLQRAKKA